MPDRKVSQLDELGTPVRGDFLYAVDNSAAFPASKRTKVESLLAGPVILVAASNATDSAKRHADYVCDGTADNVEIQSALDAVEAAGGGGVLLSAGLFSVVAAPTMGDNTTFSGLGRGTHVKLASGANCDVVTNSDLENGNTRLLIQDMYLDGNRLNQSHVVGDGPGQSCLTLVNCNKSAIRNVWGTSPRLHGIDLTVRDVSGNPDDDPGCSDIIVTGCGFEDFGDDGLTIHYSERVTISSCVFWNAAASYSGSSNGIECDDGSHDITVSGCLINDCISGVVCQAHSGRPPSYNVAINGCVIQNCGEGIQLSAPGSVDPDGVDAERIVATGCIIRDCTTAFRSNNYRNIKLVSCTILDCTNFATSTSTDITRTCNLTFDNCVVTNTPIALNMSLVGPITFHQCTLTDLAANPGLNIAMPDVTLDGCVISGTPSHAVNLAVAGVRAKVINCSIRDNGGVGIRVTGAVSDFRIENNEIRNNGTNTGQLWFDDGGCSGLVLGNTIVDAVAGIYLEGNGANVLISNNYIEGSSFTIRYISSPTGYKVRHNHGFVSESAGTATVPNGATTVVVSHGLGKAPTLQEIHVTATNNLGNAAQFWISTPTATQFTINVDADPGATTATFVWQAALL